MLTLLMGFALIAVGLAAITGRAMLRSRRMPGVFMPILGGVAIVLGIISLASVSFVWIGA